MRPSVMVAVLVVAVVGTAMAVMRPSPGLDPWRGLLASEQRLAGRSNTLSEITVADPMDLTRDRFATISWWPPGQQAVVYALRQTGLAIGSSLKVIGVAAWVIGLSAWTLYFSLTLRDRQLLPWLVAAFALFRMSHTSGFVYTGGETILWALFPVVALLNLRAGRATGAASISLALVAGLLSSSLATVKYSGAILVLGFGAAWIWNVMRRDAAMRTGLAWLVGAAVGGTLAYACVSTTIQGGTPASALVVPNPIAVIAWAAAGPLMAVADVTDALTTALKGLGRTGPTDGTIAWWALVTGGMFLVWLVPSYATVARSIAGDDPRRASAWRLAISVTVVTSITLAVLKLRGGIISWEGRHQQYGACLLLPFLADALSRTVRAPGWWRRVAGLACAGLLFGLPAAYGAAALASKTLVRSPRLRTAFGSTGVPLKWSTEGRGAVAFAREVSSLPEFRSALLVTPAQDIALTFPEHRLLLVMDRGDWWDQSYRGRPPGGVLLLVPPGVDAEDMATVRRQFEDIHRWTQVALTSVPGAQVWLGQ